MSVCLVVLALMEVSNNQSENLTIILSVEHCVHTQRQSST